MKYTEYEIYVPTVDNDDNPYPHGLAESFKQRLIKTFGGLTDTRHRNEGVWRVGKHTMRDEIVIWRVLAEDKVGEEFMSALKVEMEQKFRQEKILILSREVQVL